MEEKATDKQTALLKKLGVSFDYNMSKQEASQLIEECIDKNKYHKEIKAPQVDTIVSKPPFKKFDTSSYYVAYCKDLCIASLEAATKRDKEIELDKLMELAIHCIHMAKDEFSK